jgi:hypothetical protein
MVIPDIVVDEERGVGLGANKSKSKELGAKLGQPYLEGLV